VHVLHVALHVVLVGEHLRALLEAAPKPTTKKGREKERPGVVYAVPAPCAKYEQKSLLLQVLHVPELGLGPRVGLLVVVLDVDVVLELVLAREVLGAERAHVLALKETLRD